MPGYIRLRDSEDNDRCAISVSSDASSTSRNDIVITGHKVFGLRIETIWRLFGTAISIIALVLTMITFVGNKNPPAMPAFLVSLVALGLNASPIGWGLRRLITSTEICQGCKERVLDHISSVGRGAAGFLHAGVALMSFLHGILVITLHRRRWHSHHLDNAAGAMLIILSFIHIVHVFFGLTFKHRLEIKLVPVKSGGASCSVRSHSPMSTYQDTANAPEAQPLDPETTHAAEAKV